MAVTGSALLAVLIIAALSVAVAGVLAWPRVRGGRVLATCQRAGVVLLGQIAALLVLAAAVNDYGSFYTTWGDVGGIVSQSLGAGHDHSDHSGPHALIRDETVHRHTLSNGDGPAAAGSVNVHRGGRDDPARWSRTGRLDSVTALGGITGLHEHAYVYLPPEYFQPRFAASRFPAVEVFTGYPGDDTTLIHQLHYPRTLQTLEREHRAKPMVLVMLRPSVTYPRDTECTDVPRGPQALTFLAADVPAQISRVYRVRPTRWGAVGDSTGGYCAAKIAMTHSLVFGAAASLSGYYFALHDRTTGNLWGGSRLVRNLNDLRWRMTHLPPPPVSLLIATARTETGPDGYRQALSFARIVRAPASASLLVERSGGHNFRTWAREVPYALSWMSQRIDGTP